MIDAWKGLDPDIIKKSFRCCALSNATDGTEDNEITCFAPGKPLASGRERLLQAIENRHEDVSRDPFILNDSDIENNPANEVDEDSGTDEDVEII